MLKIKQVVPPKLEPVNLEVIKSQLKIDETDTDYDSILTPLLAAARDYCETYQNRAYITQTFELALNRWPGKQTIRLPRPQLQSIESVRYITADGVSVIWDESNYFADDFSEPGMLIKANGVQWPSSRLAPENCVIIRYVSGYGNLPDDVPERIRQAITMLTIFWYENGMCDAPAAVKSLLALDRVVPL